MKDRLFRNVVVVEPRLGRHRYVRSVAEAGRVLLKEWPDERGRKHAAAMKAVLDSLKGRQPPSVARKALLAAAKEAGILAETTAPPVPLNVLNDSGQFHS